MARKIYLLTTINTLLKINKDKAKGRFISVFLSPKIMLSFTTYSTAVPYNKIMYLLDTYYADSNHNKHLCSILKKEKEKCLP